MARDRKNCLIICLLTVTIAVVPTAVIASEKVYQTTLPGTVWIRAVVDVGKTSFGSGALIDDERKWVITNYHVVERQDQVTVFFPVQKNGEVVAEKAHYILNQNKLAITGRVIFRDMQKDLAIIQLARLPGSAQSIKLASRSARPGQSLHVVGNPNGAALWVYTSGTVRTVYNKNWTAKLADGKLLYLDARVVETQLPINPGDSGGPVVNDDSELVAVVSSYNKVQQLVSTCIDLSEVKRAVARASKGESGDNQFANQPQSSGPLNQNSSSPPAPSPGSTGPQLPPPSGPQLPFRGSVFAPRWRASFCLVKSFQPSAYSPEYSARIRL